MVIWRELHAKTAVAVATEFENVFFERGPVEEIIMDNSTAFCSELFQVMLEKWNIQKYYKAAYRPGRNEIVERNHQTVNALAERGGISYIETTFWYNMAPKIEQMEELVTKKRHPRDALTKNDEVRIQIQIG